MRSVGWFVIALFAAAPVRAQERGPTTSGARVTAQLATGVLLTPVGFFATGWATKRLTLRAGWPEERARRAAYVAAWTGAALAAAAGPALVGNGGRFPAALGGAGVGLGLAVFTARLGNWRYDGGAACGPLCWTLGMATMALPSVGATVGYQVSRPG